MGKDPLEKARIAISGIMKLKVVLEEEVLVWVEL